MERLDAHARMMLHVPLITHLPYADAVAPPAAQPLQLYSCPFPGLLLQRPRSPFSLVFDSAIANVGFLAAQTILLGLHATKLF